MAWNDWLWTPEDPPSWPPHARDGEALGNSRWEKWCWCGSSSTPVPESFPAKLVSPWPCTHSSGQSDTIRSSHTRLSGVPWGWLTVWRWRLTSPLPLSFSRHRCRSFCFFLPCVFPPASQLPLHLRSPPQHCPPTWYFLVSHFLE